MHSNPDMHLITRWLILIVVLSQNARAENPEPDGLDLIQGSDEMQSIAAGHPVPTNLSPSVTSVMTSKDIERIGARRLSEVLEYLPGVHVSSARNGNSVIGFRGGIFRNKFPSIDIGKWYPLEEHPGWRKTT